MIFLQFERVVFLPQKVLRPLLASAQCLDVRNLDAMVCVRSLQMLRWLLVILEVLPVQATWADPCVNCHAVLNQMMAWNRGSVAGSGTLNMT